MMDWLSAAHCLVLSSTIPAGFDCAFVLGVLSRSRLTDDLLAVDVDFRLIKCTSSMSEVTRD